MNKEVNDVLHTLLNLSLKDKSFNTQKQQFKIVYDYITNLQEENERLKELNENASKVCMAEHRYGVDKAEEARDYKSRCEKAIPMLKELNKKLKDILHIGIDIAEITDIENTLTGGEKE